MTDQLDPGTVASARRMSGLVREAAAEAPAALINAGPPAGGLHPRTRGD